MRKQRRGAISLPKGVHHVIARGKDYFYFQPGRGTKVQGPRIALPKDVHAPEFWIELRKAQGAQAGAAITTINAVLDLYFTSPHLLGLSKGSQTQYRYRAKFVRSAWGNLPAAGLRPHHVRELMDSLGDRPGDANSVLGFIRALSDWGQARGHFDQPLSAGVKPYKNDGGHKPWSAEQCAAAERHLTGMMRRAYFLGRYTGQRGSDIIRLGETFVDDGGFRLKQKKTGEEPWIPIESALAAEMATWERRPGPYLWTQSGKPFSKRYFEECWRAAALEIPAIAEATFHGLRGTRVVELRQRGHNTLEIQAQVGMSPPMIERYCRFADKKALGKAAVLNLAAARKGKR